MVDLNALPLSELFDVLVGDDEGVARLLELAFAEDVPRGAVDVTTNSIVDPTARTSGRLVAREPGVVAGLPLLPMMLEVAGTDESCRLELATRDGERVEAGTTLAVLEGPRREMLRVERVLLNAIGRLAGIATATARYVDAVAGTMARVCDTRKTIPGWRRLDKYAARCGGAVLHRIGLFDAAMYKDNHLAGLSPAQLGPRLREAIDDARRRGPLRYVAVEVDDLEQLERVLELPAGAVDIVMLDNFDLASIRHAVERRADVQPDVLLEASGGITLETAAAVAGTGVDRMSVGALTHSAPALDVALDLRA